MNHTILSQKITCLPSKPIQLPSHFWLNLHLINASILIKCIPQQSNLGMVERPPSQVCVLVSVRTGRMHSIKMKFGHGDMPTKFSDVKYVY